MNPSPRRRRGASREHERGAHEEAEERAKNVVHVDDDGVEYEAAGLGPGGLDPNEVLASLPEVMQKAFLAQDVPALEAALKSLKPAEANHHMKRCIDSGLCVLRVHILCWRPLMSGCEHDMASASFYQCGAQMSSEGAESSCN